MWCAVSSHDIIGPYFFENAEGLTVIVKTVRHTFMLEIFLGNELRPLELNLAMVPTGWSNCSHSSDFDASPQDSFSRQAHFSFRGQHLARPLA
jgi:hypothetical protein